MTVENDTIGYGDLKSLSAAVLVNLVKQTLNSVGYEHAQKLEDGEIEDAIIKSQIE